MALIKRKPDPTMHARGSAVAPLGAGGADVSQMPQIAPRPRFTLAAHAGHWRVRGRRVLPAWTLAYHIPGVQGTTKTGNPQALIASLRDGGYTVIGEEHDYQRAVPVPAGLAHLPRWEVPVKGRRETEHDVDDEAAFFDELVGAGVLRAPSAYQLEALHEALQRSAEASEGMAEAAPQVRPHHTRRAKAIRDQMAVVEAALGGDTSPKSPKG